MFDLHVAPHLLFVAFHHKFSLYLREALAKHSIKLVGIPQGREEPAKGHGANTVSMAPVFVYFGKTWSQHSFAWLEQVHAEPPLLPSTQQPPHHTPHALSETPVPHISTIPLCFQPWEHSTFFPWGNLQLSVLKDFNIPWSTHILRLLFPLLLQIGTAYPVYTISIIQLITYKV